MVSQKGNEWGTNYWLTRFLEGMKTLNLSLMDFECIDFLIASMIIKGEYFAVDERTQKKKVYVFEDYRLVHFVYHYKNLVIGANLQLQTMESKNSSKVWYFLPYSEHEKLTKNISVRSDSNGLLELTSLSIFLSISTSHSVT